ncbi:MAG: class I SAM-dependent methyltransferase [Promethearchaeota archaeon]
MVRDKARAWWNILKIGNPSSLIKELKNFFRGNTIRVLKNEGWFNYLKQPHTLGEIMEHFNYTDHDFLQEILDVLVEDETINLVDDDKYQTNPPVEDNWMSCRIFKEPDVLISVAKALPDRLRGQVVTFGTNGVSLFNWDDFFLSNMFEKLRVGAFSYVGKSLQRPLHILDLECYNGASTASMWVDYYRKKLFYDGSPMKISAVSLNKDLLRIAREEFLMMVQRFMGNGTDIKEIKSIERFFPIFNSGHPEKLPFDDETFDAVFANHVLQFVDARNALKEVVRVTKKGGNIFGAQMVVPLFSKFWHLSIKTMYMKAGLFSRDTLVQWAQEAGGIDVETATLAMLYKFKKG